MWQVIAARPRLTSFIKVSTSTCSQDERGTSSAAIATQVVNNSPKKSKPRQTLKVHGDADSIRTSSQLSKH